MAATRQTLTERMKDWRTENWDPGMAQAGYRLIKAVKILLPILVLLLIGRPVEEPETASQT